MTQCCRWWIPLWTLSFLAECVQWARARSWNLANETHPPRASCDAIGWQIESGASDWSVGSRASVRERCDSNSTHNLRGAPWSSKTRSETHTPKKIKKNPGWNMRCWIFANPGAHIDEFNKSFAYNIYRKENLLGNKLHWSSWNCYMCNSLYFKDPI